MKILQVPFSYYPDPVGGTEIYVSSLTKHLQHAGSDNVVVAPGLANVCYDLGGVPVYRIEVSPVHDIRTLYGEGDADVARSFGDIVDREQPDVIHLHALTASVSVRLVDQAHQRGIPVVFTYHTPTVSCQRGTLLRWGSEVCDGLLDADRCAACTLQSLGLPRPLADLTGRLPVRAGEALGRLGLQGGVWTALRMRELLEVRHASVRRLLAEVDRIVAVCDWVRAVLEVNGVPAEKITLSRHGLDRSERYTMRAPAVVRPPSMPIRLAYLGRLEPVKGVHCVIRALRTAPQVPIELHVYGVVQGQSGNEYMQQLQDLAAGDARIRFHAPVPNDEAITLLRGFDALVVPSQWLETGPLVVLEAFAAGIPVVGSDLGGIAELVKHGVNGMLVAPQSIEAWSAMLRRLTAEPELLPRLRSGVQAPRSMEDVAVEMSMIYAELVSGRINDPTLVPVGDVRS